MNRCCLLKTHLIDFSGSLWLALPLPLPTEFYLWSKVYFVLSKDLMTDGHICIVNCTPSTLFTVDQVPVVSFPVFSGIHRCLSGISVFNPDHLSIKTNTQTNKNKNASIKCQERRSKRTEKVSHFLLLNLGNNFLEEAGWLFNPIRSVLWRYHRCFSSRLQSYDAKLLKWSQLFVFWVSTFIQMLLLLFSFHLNMCF